MVQGLQQQLQSAELKNQKLVLELAHLKRMRFGTKSEALTTEQRALFEDDADQDLAAVQVELDATAPAAGDATRKPRAGAGRRARGAERIADQHDAGARRGIQRFDLAGELSFQSA